MERLVPTLPPSRAFACARSGCRLRGLGLYRPRQTPVLGAQSSLASFPALGRARPHGEAHPRARPGKTTARNFGSVCGSVKKGKLSSLVWGCSRRFRFWGGGGGVSQLGQVQVRMCVRSRWALIERPLSTSGRGCVSPARGGCVSRPRGREAGGGAQAACARGACGWGGGRAGGGVSPRLARSLAGWRAPPLPSRAGNPGRVVAAAAYVSAVSRRGRAGRPGGRERSLGGRAAGAERGGGPRRVGGQGPRRLQPRAKPSCPSGSCPARAAARGGAR